MPYLTTVAQFIEAKYAECMRLHAVLQVSDMKVVT